MKAEDIQGWFDFEDIYLKMIDQSVGPFPLFVEVGCWLGKSSAFMASAIKKSRKNIKLHCVDIWQLTNDDKDLHRYVGSNIDLYSCFINNMRDVGVLDIITPVKSDSVAASLLYIDNSIDFVFIDANHSYEFVKKDILSWLPKVKSGGYIGGHDYGTYLGVTRAVDELFDKKEIFGISWLVKKI